MKKLSNILLMALSLFIFIGCSSSGGSDSGSDPVKNITSIEDAENSAKTLEVTRAGIDNGVITPDAKMLGKLSKLVVVDSTETYTCASGGTISLTGRENDFTMVMNNCTEDGITLDGNIRVQITYPTNDEVKMLLTSDAFSIESSDVKMSCTNVTETYKTDIDYNPFTIILDGTYSFDMSHPYDIETTYVYDNLIVVFVFFNNEARLSIDGTIDINAKNYSCVNGQYTYVTIEPLGENTGVIKINDVTYRITPTGEVEATFSDGTQKTIDVSNNLSCS